MDDVWLPEGHFHGPTSSQHHVSCISPLWQCQSEGPVHWIPYCLLAPPNPEQVSMLPPGEVLLVVWGESILMYRALRHCETPAALFLSHNFTLSQSVFPFSIKPPPIRTRTCKPDLPIFSRPSLLMNIGCTPSLAVNCFFSPGPVNTHSITPEAKNKPYSTLGRKIPGKHIIWFDWIFVENVNGGIKCLPLRWKIARLLWAWGIEINCTYQLM